MRGNGGGVLGSATLIAGLFLPDQATILYEYRGDENLRVYRTRRPIFRTTTLPP